MNTITAKKASIARNSAAETTTNTGSRNRRSGSSGSGALRSRATKAPVRSRAAAARPAISAEPQAYSRPPQEVKSRMQVSAPASSAPPR